VFSLPINLLTINQFFGKKFSPAEAAKFIATVGDSSIEAPRTFEEQALASIGRELYECFFRGYTRKQWGVDPRELPASILKRLPIRFNYEDNYYVDPWQGIPTLGYTRLVERMLDHPAITLRLSTRALPAFRGEFDHVFWSGPIDGYFGRDLGALRYRTLDFEWFYEDGDHQGNAVLNYCEESVPFTRVTEHKHLAPFEQHTRTICCREYSRAAGPDDIPFYPLRLDQDKQLLRLYQRRALEENKVSFIGRLGTYRYLDMDACIDESLRVAAEFLAHDARRGPFRSTIGFLE
jgi:UDP-galactopyranose mutase